jgi:hypothetical protein
VAVGADQALALDALRRGCVGGLFTRSAHGADELSCAELERGAA